MTEISIQNDLYYWLTARKQHKLVLPNTMSMFRWESDLISVTKADIIHEYEIKISVEDFKNDLEIPVTDTKRYCKRLRKEVYSDEYKGSKSVDCASYFWYVTPENLISKADVPDYAGLIYIRTDSCYAPIIHKKAPKINDNKMTEHQLNTIARGLMFRMWKLRTSKTKN